jgi:hypothetical protein
MSAKRENVWRGNLRGAERFAGGTPAVPANHLRIAPNKNAAMFPSRHLASADWRKLARAIVAAYSVTLLVTSREGGPVNLTEVAEACLLEVVRAFVAKALRFFAIVFSGLETLLVAMLRSGVSTVKDVLAVAIVAVWITIGPSPKATAKRTIRTNDYHSSPVLRFNRSCRNKRNSGEHQRREDNPTNLFQISAFHVLHLLVRTYLDAFVTK